MLHDYSQFQIETKGGAVVLRLWVQVLQTQQIQHIPPFETVLGTLQESYTLHLYGSLNWTAADQLNVQTSSTYSAAMKYGLAIVDQICLLEHLALHMLQALNLVILGNHGLNQILLGLHSIIVISITMSMHAKTWHCSHEYLSLFAQNPVHNQATED